MKKFLLSAVVVMCVLLFALPSFSAMSDDDFIELCYTGTAQQVEEAIKAGANVNAKDKHGRTALMQAVINTKNPEVITELIKAGADVNAKSNTGVTALMRAAGSRPNPEVIAELIKAGANVNAKSENGWQGGWTALMYAAWDHQNTEFITALIKAGADINAKDNSGRTALMLAACFNKNPEVITALIKAGADVNAKAKNGRTAFDFALINSSLRDTGILRELMITAESERFLQLCAIGSYQEVANAIKAGANVNAKDDSGWTALMIAAANNQNPEVITALLKAGANINAKDKHGWTALDYARDNNNTAAIKCLEPITAMKDEEFLELCKTGTAQQVEEAIKAGANLNAKDNNGNTALMLAEKYNENLEVLYKVGVMLATGDGVEEDQWEAVEWLRAAAKKGHKAARNELAKRGIYN